MDADAERVPFFSNGDVCAKYCRHGPMLYLANDVYIGQSLEKYGEFSEKELVLLAQLVRPGDMILDVGANIGTHTVFLAKKTGPSGRVLAFEPQAAVFRFLCANVVLNGLSNVDTFHAAVGARQGTIRVPDVDFARRANFGGLSLEGIEQGKPVCLATVDALNLSACHFIKIDVEGMENEVLEGAEQTIRKYRPVLYLENDRPEKSPALIERLLGLDYRLYWHFPFLFNPHNHFADPENCFEGVVSINLLCIHRSVSPAVHGMTEVASPDERWEEAFQKTRRPA